METSLLCSQMIACQIFASSPSSEPAPPVFSSELLNTRIFRQVNVVSFQRLAHSFHKCPHRNPNYLLSFQGGANSSQNNGGCAPTPATLGSFPVFAFPFSRRAANPF